MSKKLILLGVSLMALQAYPAHAQDSASSKPEGRHGSMMQKIDTNEDGTISAEESSAAAKARFAKMDADGDGKITKADFEAHKQEWAAEHGTEHSAEDRNHPRMMHRFEEMDSDKDGALTEDEVMARSEARHKKLDADGNGEGTKGEAQSMKEKFHQRRQDMKEKREERREHFKNLNDRTPVPNE